MIYSYNKNQSNALFLKLIFDKELYVFRTDLLPIIRSLNTVYTAIGICHASYVDCLLARYTVLRLLMMDSRSVQNMYSSLSKISLRNSASRRFLSQELKVAFYKAAIVLLKELVSVFKQCHARC